MEASTPIRSRSNPLLKRVGAVLAGRERDTIVLEGERLIADAARAGARLDCLLVAEGRDVSALRALLAGVHPQPEVRRVVPELLQRASGLEVSPGVLALCKTPVERPLRELALARDALVLVVCGLADPGNLGALARSAEAAGASVLAIVQGGVSPWNAKALRGSMGSLLRLPVVRAAEPCEVVDALDDLGFRHVVARTRGGLAPEAFDWSDRIALWVAGETGRAPDVARSFEGVTLPMAGAVESLNVTVAASMLLYAARRHGGGRS